MTRPTCEEAAVVPPMPPPAALLELWTQGGDPPAFDLGEGAPWWAYLILAVLAILAPLVIPRLFDLLRRGTGSTITPQTETAIPPPPPSDDDEQLEELRDSLIQVLQDLQAKTREAAALARSLAEKEEEATELARNLAAREAEVRQLQTLIDALIARREQATQHPPPGPSTTAG